MEKSSYCYRQRLTNRFNHETMARRKSNRGGCCIRGEEELDWIRKNLISKLISIRVSLLWTLSALIPRFYATVAPVSQMHFEKHLSKPGRIVRNTICRFRLKSLWRFRKRNNICPTTIVCGCNIYGFIDLSNSLLQILHEPFTYQTPPHFKNLISCTSRKP